MAQELQSLLDRINEDGVRKASAERDVIVQDARKQAASIIAEAEEKAVGIIAKAQTDARDLEERSEKAVRQTSRDLILALEDELAKRMRAAVASSVRESLSPEFMAQIIAALAEKFAQNPDDTVSVECAAKDQEKLDAALKNALRDSLEKSPELLTGRNLGAGFKISFGDKDCYFDFSDEAMTALVASYAGGKLSEILRRA
ncbi:MAG: hypothetical protein PHS41_02595 [Victivallaceae bacterium]|nr:hypothetical protein [Victivallaceae bacterium]